MIQYTPELLAAFRAVDPKKLTAECVQTGTDFHLALFAAGWTACGNKCMEIVRNGG